MDITLPDKNLRKFHKHLIKEEIRYAEYLGVGNVYLKVQGEKIVERYTKFLTKVKGLYMSGYVNLIFDVSKDQPDAW